MRHRTKATAAISLVFLVGFAVIEAHAQNPREERGRQALERAQGKQQEIQRLALRLKDKLLELNRLRRLPQNDPNYENARSAMTDLNGEILNLAAAIYAIDQDSFADFIANEKPFVSGLLANGLSAGDREALHEAGFTREEIADLSATIRVMSVRGLPDQKITIPKDPKTATGAVLKIGAGALLIGVDIGSRFIPLLNAVTTFEAISSVAGGTALVADGIAPKEAQPNPPR